MFTHVILRAIKGNLEHRDVVLADGQSYVLGRAGDCAVRLSSPRISRHHCRLDVYSPTVFLRDLGSLNGTLLNGADIGQHNGTRSPGDGTGCSAELFALSEGDVLRIGDNLFWIDFIRPEDDADATSGQTAPRAACETCS